MVLSGTLREFILADVFQLLAQQKITGKLVLSNGKIEGSVLFKDGLIVSAEKTDEQLVDKLFNYLVDMKAQQPAVTKTMFTPFEGNAEGLTTEIARRGIMTESELHLFCESAIEDIACSLFLWNSGTYRFNSLRSVDNLIPAKVVIPTENIVMEAMRRVDEWHRMKEYINDDTVFVKTDKDAAPEVDSEHLYIYYRVDGTSTVRMIIMSSCLTEYRVYEIIYNLIQDNKLLPLSPQLSRSIQAALEKREREKESPPFPVLVSVLASIGIILLLIFIGFFLFRTILLSDINTRHREAVHLLDNAQVERKSEIARLQYRSLYCSAPPTKASLIETGLMDQSYYNVFRH